MAYNPYLDPTDQQIDTPLPQANTSPQVGFGAAMLGGLVGHLTGTISPLQARAMGMPQAAGLTMQQLQVLAQSPEMQARTQQTQLQNQFLQRQLNPQTQNPVRTFQDPQSKAWFYIEPDAKGRMVAKPLSSSATGGGNKLSPEDIQAGVEYLKTGGTSQGIRGRGAEVNKIFTEYEKQRKANPGLMSRGELDQTYKADQRRLSTLNSAQSRDQIVSVDQFNSAIDRAMQLIDKLGNSNFIPLNKIKIAAATGLYAKSPYAADVSELNALSSEIGLQGSKTFSGSAATDIRFKNELTRLNASQTPAQFKRVADRLKQIANVRKSAIINMPTLGVRGNSQLAPQQPQIQTNNNDPLGLGL